MLQTSRMGSAATVALVAFAGCRPREPAGEGFDQRSATPQTQRVAIARFDDVSELEWRDVTTSPQRSNASSDDELSASCPRRDGALQRVAERIARRASKHAGTLDGAEIEYALRAEGAPYVWPRVWVASGASLSTRQVSTGLQELLSRAADDSEPRCGIAMVEGNAGIETVAAVVVDTWADLDPVPTMARLGQWLRLEARFIAPATDAKWIALGPSGPPRSIPTAFSSGRARAAVSVDQRGEWVLQLLASTESGPRPALEALVFVNQTPPASFAPAPAPGEEAARPGDTLRAALAGMVNRARRSEDLPPLEPSALLDEIARAHAEAMMRSHRLAHDVGDGDPNVRTRRAGLELALLGENVAHAASIARAHRTIWSSPSHRGNVLFSRFDSLGVGVAKDGDGSVWVCELFANFANAGIGP